MAQWLSSWFAEQVVQGSIPRLATWISEIGYLPLPSHDMSEISLKRRKSSIQPTNQPGDKATMLHMLVFMARLFNWYQTICFHVQIVIWHLCLLYMHVFLAHLSRRLKWAIVIAHRPSSVRRPSGVNFHIFDFSSETAERNSTKLYRKQDLNALYQVCVFRADPKNKMAALASDWLRHFRLLLWNR